jgi:hypothetical protein
MEPFRTVISTGMYDHIVLSNANLVARTPFPASVVHR